MTTRFLGCLCLALVPLVSGVNFDTCLQEVKNGTWGLVGGTDNAGRPVNNISEATSITYDLCLVACGKGSEPFVWKIFSQQFSAWLLPYMALVSQLPFGANNRLDNLVSILLTVGSPTLAAYSLALTVLNGWWIAQRFSALSYPNVQNAVKILTNLQQSALRVTNEESLLASLVILHSNDEFWEELSVWLNYVHTWSLSAVASIVWVIIAYVFTVVDSFTSNHYLGYRDPQRKWSSSGIRVPVAYTHNHCPKCDFNRVHQAMERANKIAYIATLSGKPTLASNISSKRAMYFRKDAGNDEQCAPPVFNYARFFPWTLAVENVYCVFLEASKRSDDRQPVDWGAKWTREDKNMTIHPDNRQGSLEQVEAYIRMKPRSRWGPGVVSRFLLAAMLALSLTWGTIGAAILVAFFVPTKGLACRSGSYLIYGATSTLVWILLVISSVLAHYSTFTVDVKGNSMRTKSTRTAGVLSIILRRLGKVLAAMNSIWIVLACLLHFGNFFDRCWCNSSVLYLGSRAYNVIDLTPEDVAALNGPWIGGVALASGCAIVFIAFVSILVNPTLPI
ncbi:hypothetical protein MVEN_00210300 [Mycena venus]|uniref:Uncharacterized protein n=1 Tax=Mycena venus TaxID=2733690 RepID=A0A8H7DE61_9AGAR|nr:hypothetical protein MVEN_00210300 [Mycena venus]